MGLYKCLIIFELHNSQHGIMIHIMKGGVGGNFGFHKLCVTLYATIIIVFKRGGGHHKGDVLWSLYDRGYKPLFIH